MTAARADQVIGPDDLLPPVLGKGHGDTVAIGPDRRCFDAELDLKAPPGQMVAQHGLSAPLGLTALEFVFAAQARELDEPDARLPWTEKLDLSDARAIGEKRLDSRQPYRGFRALRLKRSPARLMMRRGPPLHNSWPYAVTEEFTCREEARGAGADDENPRLGPPDISLCGPQRHSGSPNCL